MGAKVDQIKEVVMTLESDMNAQRLQRHWSCRMSERKHRSMRSPTHRNRLRSSQIVS